MLQTFAKNSEINKAVNYLHQKNEELEENDLVYLKRFEAAQTRAGYYL